MFALYVTLTCLTAIAAASAAWLNFTRHPIPVAAANQIRIPPSWTLPLGALLAAGALGLVTGFVIPALGIAAATGLVLYFIGAVIAHLRVRDFDLGQAGAFLALSTATLAATIAYQLQ